MKPITPITMWAICHEGRRQNFILHSTVRRTRKESIAEFTSWWREGHPKRNWKVHYREGTRCVKVIVKGANDV